MLRSVGLALLSCQGEKLSLHILQQCIEFSLSRAAVRTPPTGLPADVARGNAVHFRVTPRRAHADNSELLLPRSLGVAANPLVRHEEGSNFRDRPRTRVSR